MKAYSPFEQYNKAPSYNSHSGFDNPFESYSSDLSSSSSWTSNITSPPAYNRTFWYTLYILDGLFQGSIDVLPSTSLIGLCKSNITDVYTNYEELVTYFNYSWTNISTNSSVIGVADVEDDMVTALEGLQGLLQNSYGICFNCYYSYFIGTSASTYDGLFEPITILKNMLYGLGYIYQNVYYALTMSNSVTYVYYYALGYEIGNSLIRFFYQPDAELND